MSHYCDVPSLISRCEERLIFRIDASRDIADLLDDLVWAQHFRLNKLEQHLITLIQNKNKQDWKTFLAGRFKRRLQLIPVPLLINFMEQLTK